MSDDVTHAPVAMTIAGSDSGGGAGIQMDLRVMSSLGVYGCTALTALTAQNPNEVRNVVGLDAEFVSAQVQTVVDHYEVAAIKTGMLWSQSIIKTIAEFAANNRDIPFIVDPVMIATSGAKLVTEEAINTYKEQLLPLATLMTPNLDEAEVLLDGHSIQEDNMEAAATMLRERYKCDVLLKGGHLNGDPFDVLMSENGVKFFQHVRVPKVNTHGSGCCLSAAITSYIALGNDIETAVTKALNFLQKALQTPITPQTGDNPEPFLGVEKAAGSIQ